MGWEDITEENYPTTEDEKDRTVISFISCGKRVYLNYRDCRLGWGILMEDDLSTKLYRVPKYEDDLSTNN